MPLKSVLKRETLLEWPDAVVAAYTSHFGKPPTAARTAFDHLATGCEICLVYATIQAQARGMAVTAADIDWESHAEGAD